MATQETTAQPAPESAKPKMPVLMGMVAVGAVIGSAVGVAFLGPMVATKAGKTLPAAAAHDSASADGEHAAPAEGGEGGEGGAAEAAVHLLDNLVLNPAGSNGSRFLLLSVAIEASAAPMVETFKSRDAELRDIVLTALGTKSVDELTDMSKRDVFKTDLAKAIDEHFGKKAVKRLYFPQFVVQ
jgi:flagellar FliL protein